MNKKYMDMSSPLDRFSEQEVLEGYVAQFDEDEFYVHGEQVLEMMGRGASYSSMVLLTLTGERAEAAQVARFERALQLCAMMDIAETPCHVARLARVQRAESHNVASAACISLANRARSILDHTHELQVWLEVPDSELPMTREQRLGAGQFVKGALRGFNDRELVLLQHYNPSLDECVVALLHASGLTERWQKEAALTMAGLPLAMAEAFFAPARLKDYPVNVPEFEYVHEV